MHSLSELIIERIDLIKILQQKLQTSHATKIKHTSIQAELQLNKSILREYSILKKRQKERIVSQAELLEQIKEIKLWQSEVAEKFLSLSLAIFSRHSIQYLSLLESGLTTIQQLEKLYHQFTREKHSKDYKIHIHKVINIQITQFTPAYLLNWICEWSRINLRQLLKKLVSNEFQRHEQQLKQISLIKSSTINEPKQKILNPLSVSSQVCKANEIIPQCIFTNKESVYGLFLDELNQYYKQLPLELDMNFIKSMKKLHSKGNQLQREDNLAKAAEILIQVKNKHIKEEMQTFCSRYYQKHPKIKQRAQSERLTASQSEAKVYRFAKKVCITRQFGIQRIKSQNKEQSLLNKVSFYAKNKDSLLLCPKQAQISFDIGNNLKRKQKHKKDLQLPEILPARPNGSQPRSISTKNKPFNLLHPVSKSLISNYQNALLRSSQKGKKKYENKQSQSMQRGYRKNNFSCTNQSKLEIFQNPEISPKKGYEEQINVNRKLMLQLLREKNKYVLIDK